MAGSSATERIDTLHDKVARKDAPADKEAVVLPEGAAAPSDDSPTIISKAAPTHHAKRTESTDIDGIRGRSLAHFELIESIGVGGMAAVLRARDKQLERFVALKILPPEMASDPENVRRFHYEARAAARLDHENIARVFYYAEDQGLHFIAFEFVEGKNVRVLIEERGGPLSVAEALHYVLQIACGLEHAASRGVVHRDIKPSNIIITPTGRAKLVDMGLARSIGRHDDRALTQSGVTLGTFDYISPEQALEPREADTRSDIYSLGCTFYHMVTGHAPVPEGTAAKKLHHHQHVAPLDPRELNPEVPHEVAAILARMMHKDPRARYQTPRHLVQHLLQAAQMVDAAPDMSNEVLFVDTPLPTPPQKRPLLVLSLAAVLLGGFLFALSLLPPQQSVVVPQKDTRAVVEPKNGQQKGPETPPKNLSGTHRVSDEGELRRALTDANVTRIILENSLPETIMQPLVASSLEDEERHLTIESENEREPVSISIKTGKFDPQHIHDGIWAGLILQGKGTVKFRNLQFVLESLDVTPQIMVAAVALRGSGTFIFERCTFSQEKVPLGITDESRFPISSVVLEGVSKGQGKLPLLILDKCLFKKGQVAVALRGAGVVRPTDCVLGAHAALFNLKADTPEPRSKLELANCTLFVVRGPAFRLDDAASCFLSVRHSIFSSPKTEIADPKENPSLILQPDADAPDVTYKGYRNCYHNLNVYWARPNDLGTKVFVRDLFLTSLARNNGEDRDSSELPNSVNPFVSATPLKEIDNIKAGDDVLAINPELPQLRETEDVRDSLRHTSPLGVTWGAKPGSLATLLPKEPLPERLANQLWVIPDVKESLGVYSSLYRAINNARDGDEILVQEGKSSRFVEVEPATIKAGVNITIKPFSPKHRPILIIPAKSTLRDKIVRLLTIHDSKVELQNLEVLLDPKQPLSEAGVVELAGSGQCTFRRCVITLKGGAVPLYGVALREPLKEMRMDNMPSPRMMPVVEVIHSFVRGEGDLLRVPASRSFELALTNSLLALSGAVLHAKGTPDNTFSTESASIRLDRASVFLREPAPMFNLEGGAEGKGLVVTRVDSADSCLFVSLLQRSPMVQLTNVHLGDSTMQEIFKGASGANAYCGFDELFLRHVPFVRMDDFAMLPMTFGKDNWKKLSGENESLFGPLPRLPASLTERAFSLALPSDFDLSDAILQKFGARLSDEELPPLTGAIFKPDRPTFETLQIE